MANPFTSVTVSGYNASPPADDGSAVATNQLQWSKHKTKIGDPLKTAIESINTNVLAAFGKRFGTTLSEHSTNYQIVPGDQGKFFIATAALTFTLPAVADAGDGFPLAILNNGAGSVTIDGNASELINGGTSVTLAADEFLLLTCDGSEWVGAKFTKTINTSQLQDVETKYKTADETVNNSDSLQSDDHLAGYALTAGAYYQITGFLHLTTTVAADFKMALVFTNAPQKFALTTAGGSTSTAGASITFTVSGTEVFVYVHGYIRANAVTGGTVELQWAQGTADVSDTILKEGSWLVLRKVS